MPDPEPKHVVGLMPWLPWPLSRSPWWTEPIRAERLAAFRIGIGLVLLLDVFGTYWPRLDDFFGRDSVAPPGMFPITFPGWHGRILSHVSEPWQWHALFLLWAGAALGLVLGVKPRLCAVYLWFMSVGVQQVNIFLNDAGDAVRNIGLFYLMLTPSNAVWALLPSSRRPGPVFIPPWPIRLLFIQLLMIYFFPGMYKVLFSPQWSTGLIMHHVLHNLGGSRFSATQLGPFMVLALRASAIVVKFWELTFPLLVCLPRTRIWALIFGVLFHLGTDVFMCLGAFPFYVLCLYLPLLPCERLTDRGRETQGGGEVS